MRRFNAYFAGSTRYAISVESRASLAVLTGREAVASAELHVIPWAVRAIINDALVIMADDAR